MHILGVRAAPRSPVRARARSHGGPVYSSPSICAQIDYEESGKVGAQLLRRVQEEFALASGRPDARERLDAAERFFVRRWLVRPLPFRIVIRI